MDRNTIIGFACILLILIGFQYFNQPSEEELRQRHERDSIARVEAERIRLAQEAADTELKNTQGSDSTTQKLAFIQGNDSAQIFTLENNKVRLNINTLGGTIESVELKGYTTSDSMPLVLWHKGKSTLGLNFYAEGKQINTQKLYFRPELTIKDSTQTLSMRLYADSTKYLEYVYSLKADSYMTDFNIRTYNLGNVIASNTSFLALHWGVEMPQLEKSKEYENRYTNVYYNFSTNEVDFLSAAGNIEEALANKLKWVAFKQQFFSSVLIANTSFNNVILTSNENLNDGYLKNAFADIQLPYEGKGIENYEMQFYFGPNNYSVLEENGKDILLPELVNLGWSWISWFNRWVVIPLFGFLEKYVTGNYGLIIFLLTLIIKCVLFPLTYKSYKSQAKMRVLKPQVDEINARIPKSKTLERQQATMALYKKAGVNPMGGCIPMALQMPILLALFQFFPSAIELRQESFLWADDLASYDSIATLPFNIPFYGSHVSLFCLLMTIANIIYTRVSMKNQAQNEQMKSMRMMMYLMPVMFLFICNNYSAALSYYYFISLLITVVQMWIIRKTTDDKKLMKQIELAKSKPGKKPSKFQMKLAELQKMQEQKLRERKK